MLAAEPDQALAAQYRTKAVASYPNEVTATSPWAWAGVGAGSLVLLTSGAVVAFVLVRQRRKGRPAAFCPNCAAPHPAGARFCESCGHPLTGSASHQTRADHG